MTNSDIPADVRMRDVISDSQLSPAEKEVRILCPNDKDACVISTEIPTIIKWVQSIEESAFEWVRTDESGAITAIKAEIPKGIITLRSASRKSDRHSSMVNYGPYRTTEKQPEQFRKALQDGGTNE